MVNYSQWEGCSGESGVVIQNGALGAVASFMNANFEEAWQFYPLINNPILLITAMATSRADHHVNRWSYTHCEYALSTSHNRANKREKRGRTVGIFD